MTMKRSNTDEEPAGPSAKRAKHKSSCLLSGYAGKEVELSTVLPQGLATLPLRAQFVNPVNKM